VIVVDCTVLADHLFGAAAARESSQALMELEPEWISHDLIFYEIGNVAWKCSKFGQIKRDDAEAALSKTGGLLMEIERDLNYPGIYRLAAETGLTFYDASYVWLARTRDLKLRTRDKEVLRICPDVAVGMP
jgi:predicted nucleic acid-binding protein